MRFKPLYITCSVRHMVPMYYEEFLIFAKDGLCSLSENTSIAKRIPIP